MEKKEKTEEINWKNFRSFLFIKDPFEKYLKLIFFLKFIIVVLLGIIICLFIFII